MPRTGTGSRQRGFPAELRSHVLDDRPPVLAVETSELTTVKRHPLVSPIQLFSLVHNLTQYGHDRTFRQLQLYFEQSLELVCVCGLEQHAARTDIHDVSFVIGYRPHFPETHGETSFYARIFAVANALWRSRPLQPRRANCYACNDAHGGGLAMV